MRKYTLYAIGEIALVVIGILIALQINNWNEERKNRIYEIEILGQLHKEFTHNKKEFELVINGNKDILERLSKLASFFPISQASINRDTLINFLGRRFIEGAWTFNPSNAIIDAIVSNNTFNLIRNDSLRIKILSWRGILEDYKEDEDGAYKFEHERLKPYLDENGIIAEQILNNKNWDISILSSLEFESLIYRKMDLLKSVYIGPNTPKFEDFKALQNIIDDIIELTKL